MFEQHFLNRKVGFEVGYNKENYDEHFSEPFGPDRVNGIDVDVNTTLVDGRVNPNFGRPYMSAWESGDRDAHIKREALRGTVYALWNADDHFKSGFGRWLGRHALTGFASTQKINQLSTQSRIGWVGGDAAFDLNENSLVGQNRAVTNLIYVGPRLDSFTSEDQVHLDFNLTARLTQPGDVREVVYMDRQTATFQTGQFTAAEGYISALKQRQKIDSQAVILQSYWLKEMLVTTVGWRNDKSMSHASTTTAAERFTSGDLTGSIDLNKLQLIPVVGDPVAGQTRSYNAVAKLPRSLKLPYNLDLSAHYGQSENFQPLAAKLNIYGNTITPPTGKTKEYGFTLFALKNRANMKFNWYETSILNAQSGAVGSAFIAETLRMDFQTMAWWYDGVNAGLVGPGMPTLANLDRLISTVPKEVKDMVGYRLGTDTSGAPKPEYSIPSNIVDVSNLVAKGLEVEGTFNLTKNWRVTFNAAKQQTQKSDTGTYIARYIAERSVVWKELGDLQRIPATPSLLPRPFESEAIRLVYNPLAGIRANDGVYSPEQRKWRFNFINNYIFSSDSPLKGVGVGGAYRWQDKAAIDYPRIVGTDGISRPDITRPFYAPSESQLDLWVSYRRVIMDKARLRVQLNVGNVFANNDLVPVTMHGWGEPAYLRVSPPRTWFVTSTIEY